MTLEKLLNKNILVVQTKSFSGLKKSQKANLSGLGLKGIGSESKLLASKAILGMVKKVNHLVKISTN